MQCQQMQAIRHRLQKAKQTRNRKGRKIPQQTHPKKTADAIMECAHTINHDVRAPDARTHHMQEKPIDLRKNECEI